MGGVWFFGLFLVVVVVVFFLGGTKNYKQIDFVHKAFMFNDLLKEGAKKRERLTC